MEEVNHTGQPQSPGDGATTAASTEVRTDKQPKSKSDCEDRCRVSDHVVAPESWVPTAENRCPYTKIVRGTGLPKQSRAESCTVVPM
jgi:hypothetical protein